MTYPLLLIIMHLSWLPHLPYHSAPGNWPLQPLKWWQAHKRLALYSLSLLLDIIWYLLSIKSHDTYWDSSSTPVPFCFFIHVFHNGNCFTSFHTGLLSFSIPTSLHPLIWKLPEDKDPICLTYNFLLSTCNNAWPITNIYGLNCKGLLYL